MKASQPTVSVIVPNYNHAAFLPQRIESILAQTYQPMEIIILDDCSSDNSLEVIARYQGDSRVSRVVRNEQNSGSTFLQWNRGFGLAKGEYVWIAESDDVAEPHFLSTLVAQLELHPDAAVAFSHSRLIDAEGRLLSEQNTHNPSPADGVTVHDSRQFLRYLLTFNFIYNASMAVFRRSALNGINEDYQRFRYCGDWHFWASIANKGKEVVEVHEMLNSFRQHPNKVTRKSTKDAVNRWHDELQTIAYIRSLCPLSGFQHACFRGRLSKRLRSSGLPHDEQEQLRRLYPQLCGGGWWSAVVYEIGKNFFGYFRRYQDMGFLHKFPH